MQLNSMFAMHSKALSGEIWGETKVIKQLMT